LLLVGCLLAEEKKPPEGRKKIDSERSPRKEINEACRMPFLR
jgi:hypothetical protein